MGVTMFYSKEPIKKIFICIAFILVCVLVLHVFHSCAPKTDNTKLQSISEYSTDTAFIHLTIKKGININQKDFDSMLYYGNISYNKSILIKYKYGEAKSLYLISNYYRRKGNYTEALNNALKAAMFLRV